MRAFAGAVALLCVATAAQASPTGTPQSNAPRGGKGTALELPFGHHRAAAVAGPESTVGSAALRGRLSQAEWRKAYIAKHGHDIVAPAHPGH